MTEKERDHLVSEKEEAGKHDDGESGGDFHGQAECFANPAEIGHAVVVTDDRAQAFAHADDAGEHDVVQVVDGGEGDDALFTGVMHHGEIEHERDDAGRQFGNAFGTARCKAACRPVSS